jgi:uncharacterized OB-fold protein
LSERTAAAAPLAGPVPAAPCIRLDEPEPYLLGLRCTACNAVFTRQHTCCQRCGSDKPQITFRASQRGTLSGYSVVMRSYPGVKVPFISAVVELSDGLVLKGVLRDIAPDPKLLTAQLPVRVVFGEVADQKDEAGNPYIAFHFVPERS